VPTSSLARAYTVLVAAGLLGMAAGSAAAGQLGNNTRTTLAAAAATLTATSLWTLHRRHTLTERPVIHTE
jgi:hypothetical protein